MIKRLFDIFFAALGLLLLTPLILIISILVKTGSPGPVFYLQQRVGQYNRLFFIFKFRTMNLNSDAKGMLTIGDRDPRITTIGYFIRKYKIDELPQLLNVLKGDMSLVGPRPEVQKYVDLYTSEQRKVLDIRPGITDMASIIYRNESEYLEQSNDPEKFYIMKIMPEKIKINLQYLDSNNSVFGSIRIIILTINAIIFKRNV